MRIAILTQPLFANYGGILQNYALQTILNRLGHNSVTIERDFHTKISVLKLVFELPKRIFTKYILRKRKYIFYEKNLNKKIDTYTRKLSSFSNKYIIRHYVPNYKNINWSMYDIFIVGSDQVWRPKYNLDTIDKMFFSFLPQDTKLKRISYAASFGTNQWEFTPEQTTTCKELLSRFNAVSVRELDGIDLCKKYLNRSDAICVLDPTLLLEREDYEKLCKEVPKIEENTLCAYILDLNDDIKNKLKTIADKNGLKLKIVSAGNNCTLSVPEWLAMFRDAKMIITDSFHGTAFSIIFNKDFYSISNRERGNSRFTSLLSQFVLSSRLYTSINEISLFDNIINWDSVNIKRDILKEYSINFLISNLS